MVCGSCIESAQQRARSRRHDGDFVIVAGERSDRVPRIEPGELDVVARISPQQVD
jgi:hypothetical protein